MKTVLCIFIVLISIPFGFGQKPVISIDFNEVEVGDPVIVTVKSTVPGVLDIDFPDEFVSGSGMQSGMKQEMDYNTGKVKTIYFFMQNGAFTKEGSYSFRAVITNKNQSYKSRPVSVRVQKQAPANEEISRRNLKQPIFGVIERSKARVYEGEPLVVNGKIYSKLKVKVQGYHPFELVGNPEVIKLNASSNLIFSPETIRGQKFASAQFGKELMFFTSPGKYQINPFEMAVLYEIEENYSETSVFTSNGSSVEVIPLPGGAPRDFIGGVGKYSFSRSFDKTSVKQGDVVTMTVTVSGYGNLHNINTPEVKLPKGIVIYGDPETDEEVDFGLRGTEGTMTFRYNLQVIGEGNFDLPEMTISYFDPEQKKYMTLREKGTTISGEKSDAFRAQLPQEIEKQNDEQSGLEHVIGKASLAEKGHFLDSVLFWPSVVSPFALAFLGGIFFTRKKTVSEKITEKTKNKERLHGVNSALKAAQAKAAAGDTRDAFGLIQQALKLTAAILIQSENISLTKLEIISGLHQAGLDEADLTRFNQLLLNCEEARYAFMDQPELFSQTLSEARELTQKLL